LLLLTITGWLDRREREALAYLIEESASSGGRSVGRACSSPMTTGGD
jgi:hypothetical protein